MEGAVQRFCPCAAFDSKIVTLKYNSKNSRSNTILETIQSFYKSTNFLGKKTEIRVILGKF